MHPFRTITMLAAAMVAASLFVCGMAHAQGGHLHSVWGSSATDVFTVGNGGYIAHYDGSRWERMESGTDADLWSVFGFSDDHVFAAGVSGTVLHYDGVRWNVLFETDPADRWRVWGTSPADIWLIGTPGGVRHFDGVQWRELPEYGEKIIEITGLPGSSPTLMSYEGLLCATNGEVVKEGHPHHGPIDAMLALPDGSLLIAGFSAIFRRQDSEWYYELVYPEGAMAGFIDLWSDGTNHVVAVGAPGLLWTRDEDEWRQHLTYTCEVLTGVWGTSRDNLFIIGENRTILHFDGKDVTAMQAP